MKIAKFSIILMLLLVSHTMFADEIKVTRGNNADFPPEYTGLNETSTLFFAIGDLAEGVIVELYKPMLSKVDEDSNRKSAQVVIVKRKKLNKSSRGIELMLSPMGSDFFEVKEKAYLILNPRDEASLTDKFDDIPPPKDNLFGDSTLYMLEEAKEKPPVDTGPPIDMDKLIDEYEAKDKHATGVLIAKAHYIQIGVFNDTYVLETNVGKLAKHLPIVVIPFRKDGKMKYRLLAGNFRPDELGIASQILRSMGYKEFFLKSTDEFLKSDISIERSGPKSAPTPKPVEIPGIEDDDEPIEEVTTEIEEEIPEVEEETTEIEESEEEEVVKPTIDEVEDNIEVDGDSPPPEEIPTDVDESMISNPDDGYELEEGGKSEYPRLDDVIPVEDEEENSLASKEPKKNEYTNVEDKNSVAATEPKKTEYPNIEDKSSVASTEPKKSEYPNLEDVIPPEDNEKSSLAYN